MGAIATLEPTALQVAPGDEVTTTIRVRNAGSVVDEFTFEVVGDATAWTVVTPEVLRLLPGDEEEAIVTFRPPRSADVRAGELPFGIKVNPKEDPAGSVVEEGTLTVAPLAEVTAELLPRTSQGRRKGRHELAVDNRGNDRLNADVLVYDDNELLEFEVKEPGLLVEPGQAQFTQLEVRPHKRFWRGPEKTLPFHVTVQSQDGIPPVPLEGTMVQRPMLPKWFWKALLAVLALILLLVLLWYFLLRPTLESAAEEAASEAAAAAADEAVDEALGGPIADQQEQIDGLTAQGNELAEQVEDVATVAPPQTLTSPDDIRLDASAADDGGTDTDSETFGEGETFAMTDILLQNPDGNVGQMEILRDGETLLRVAMENFRDLDYHFVVPVVFQEGESLVLLATCQEATAEGSDTCDVAAYVSGNLTTPASEEASS